MRISYWSSDVCSSDLFAGPAPLQRPGGPESGREQRVGEKVLAILVQHLIEAGSEIVGLAQQRVKAMAEEDHEGDVDEREWNRDRDMGGDRERPARADRWKPLHHQKRHPPQPDQRTNAGRFPTPRPPRRHRPPHPPPLLENR